MTQQEFVEKMKALEIQISNLTLEQKQLAKDYIDSLGIKRGDIVLLHLSNSTKKEVRISRVMVCRSTGEISYNFEVFRDKIKGFTPYGTNQQILSITKIDK